MTASSVTFAGSHSPASPDPVLVVDEVLGRGVLVPAPVGVPPLVQRATIRMIAITTAAKRMPTTIRRRQYTLGDCGPTGLRIVDMPSG